MPRPPIQIMQDFALDIEEIVNSELEKKGLTPDLPGLRLNKSVLAEVNPDFSINLSINDYYVWVIRGRRPLSQNPSAKKPPYDNILDWVKRRRIFFRDEKGRFISFNKTAWIIQRAVWIKGVKGRDFLTPAGGRIIKKYLQNIQNPLFNSILNQNLIIPPFKVVPIIPK